MNEKGSYEKNDTQLSTSPKFKSHEVMVWRYTHSIIWL